MKIVTIPIDQNGFNGAIKKLTLLAALLICVQYAQAQEVNANRKNGIKIDITSQLLYRNVFTLSYERVLKPNQTFAITAGYQQFPKLTSLGSGIQSTNDSKRTGFKVGGEYRFYLKKENKFLAPHGVYIGPYLSYLYFNNERNIQVTADDGSKIDAYFKSNINVINIGFQAGYQFVINDRFTIDLTFIGPSVARYGAKFQLDGNFDIDDKHEYENEILKALVDRFPMLDDLIKDKEVDATGKSNSWSFGYRYQVLIGYRFGHKK
jgi:hypothetical protein